MSRQSMAETIIRVMKSAHEGKTSTSVACGQLSSVRSAAQAEGDKEIVSLANSAQAFVAFEAGGPREQLRERVFDAMLERMSKQAEEIRRAEMTEGDE